MDELDKAIEIAMVGESRDRALFRFRRQMEEWAVALPPVEPLVLDFGLGEFDSTGLIEYWIANEAAAGYCGKYLFLFDGQSCPTHQHARKTETFFVMKGRMQVHYEGRARTLAAGELLLVEPGRDHGMTGQGPCLFLELSSPCSVDDNRFRDPRIPIGRRTGARGA
jgi:mannose-6-phosphate isomerase-like protein (cupin superfamily)